MDLVLFAMCLMVMGALTLQLTLLTELHIEARKGMLSEEVAKLPINIEKLRDRKEFMKIALLFIAALALTAIEHMANSNKSIKAQKTFFLKNLSLEVVGECRQYQC